MLVFAVVRGEENDWNAGGFLPLFDQLGELDSTHAGHLDVEHEEGELLGDKREKRLFGGFGGDQAVTRATRTVSSTVNFSAHRPRGGC